jgi:hypothetical protein
LNFVGNGFVANGRAVDVANNGTQVGGFREFEFTVAAAPLADFNGDGKINGRDFLMWQRGFGTPAPTAVKADGDADNDTDVDGADLVIWQDQYATLGPILATSTADESGSAETGAASQSVTVTFEANTWLAMPEPQLISPVTASVNDVVEEVFDEVGYIVPPFFAFDDGETSEMSSSNTDDEEAYEEAFAELAELLAISI